MVMVTMSSNSSSSNGVMPMIVDSQKTTQECVVCNDESDGLHFGKHTCRACAAFFRRTVSLKLDYACKHDNKCEIVKNARNMCRACRFQKCLSMGMLTSAVQHARDGLGKRKEVTQKRVKQPEVVNNQTPSCSSSSTPDYSMEGNMWSPPLNPANSHGSHNSATSSENSLPNGQNGNGNGNSNGNNGAYMPVNLANFSNLHLDGSNGVYLANPIQNAEFKVLHRMVEGYNNFLSLRRASYTLIDDIPRFANGDPESVPPANFATCKKTCRVEASLVMDVVVKYFHPFDSLIPQDRIKLFESFYCFFSNTERAYLSYQKFGNEEDNDRLIMPDGGYAVISELDKFYINAAKGDPAQLAQIFQSAMSYIVKQIVPHMTRIQMDDYELCALLGMFLWRDTVSDLTPGAVAQLHHTRDSIISDLHLHYRMRGYVDADVSVKLGNLFLLIPKLEQSLKLIRENYSIAELFNMIEPDGCCKRFHEKSAQ
uniref:Nuclear receptor n=1 Tax=Panagrellus redivivus TaxID=6233 RepID=A0A7E4VTE0_PANRE